MSDIRFFLGASNAAGFVSYFPDAYDPCGGGKYFLLKGGPGTGKSTFMRTTARRVEKEGFTVHYVPCSADPDSLDAVLFPELNAGILDGTAPHVLDPKMPGVCEEIVNLGACWNSARLRENRNKIIPLCLQNTQLHKKAADFLLVAARFDHENTRMAARALSGEKLERYIKRLCARELGVSKTGCGKTERRLLSAVTPKGCVFLDETIPALAERAVVIGDEWGAVAPSILSCFLDNAHQNGYDVIACTCPLFPKDKIEHLFIPELSLCLLTSNAYHPIPTEIGRKVHAGRFLDEAVLQQKKERAEFNRKAKSELIGEAVQRLAAAKTVHDAIEEYYVDAMDFEAVGRLCDSTVNKILG